MNTFLLNKLNYTREVFYCLEKASYIKNDTIKVEPLHLCLSLLLYSSLIQCLLTINKEKIKKLRDKYILLNNNTKKSSFSKKIIDILVLLNNSNYICNTVTLFYFLLKNDPHAHKIISNIISIDPLNIFTTYMSSTFYASIPTQLSPYLSLINNIFVPNVIGREKELKKLNSIIFNNINNSILLTGKEGVGKKTLLYKLIDLTYKDKTYIILDSFTLLKIKETSIIDSLFDYLDTIEKLVLYIKNFKLLESSDNDSILYFKNILFHKLKEGNYQLIGEASTIDENKLRLPKQINKIDLAELSFPVLTLILINYNKKLQVIYDKNIIFSNSVFDQILRVGANYIKEYSFPKKGFMILDSMYNNFKRNKVTTNSVFKSIASYDDTINENIMFNNSAKNIGKLEKELNRKVYGQEIVLNKVLSVLKRSISGIKDVTKPLGSFLFCGPSGTGKTELVKSISKIFAKSSLIRFDMSEYMEKHSISKLLGCPPGYVGHEEGGLLTNSIRNNPYSVVLFDEIEKAHPDINNIMLQLLDEGRITDSKGNTVDCTNTIIIYTSNLGCPTTPESFESFVKGIDVSEKEYKLLSLKVDKAIKKFFRPEFLNRLDIIAVFKPLSISYLTLILEKFLEEVKIKLINNKIPLTVDLDDKIKYLLAKISYHPLYGARPLKRIINQSIEKPISDIITTYVINSPHTFSIYLSGNEFNYSLKRI